MLLYAKISCNILNTYFVWKEINYGLYFYVFFILQNHVLIRMWSIIIPINVIKLTLLKTVYVWVPLSKPDTPSVERKLSPKTDASGSFSLSALPFRTYLRPILSVSFTEINCWEVYSFSYDFQICELTNWMIEELDAYNFQ